MAAECQRSVGEDGQNRICEYRLKFPEIPEIVLVKILQEHANDVTTCEKMLEEESTRRLYGTSPTPTTSSTPTELTQDGTKPKVSLPNTVHASPVDLIRSNSWGSSGSSGRSTPVNQIATPWVVPKFNQQGIPPNHYLSTSTGQLPPGRMVYTSGGYFYPAIPGAGQHVSPTANHTSPNAGPTSTSGYFATSTGNITTPTTADRHPPPLQYSPPSTGNQTVPSVGAHQYPNMPNQQLPVRYMYIPPINTTNNDQFSPQLDARYQSMPVNQPYGHGGVFVPISDGTGLVHRQQNVPPTTGFIPVQSTPNSILHDQLFNTLPNMSGSNSPFSFDMKSDPYFPQYQPGMVHGAQGSQFAGGLATQRESSQVNAPSTAVNTSPGRSAGVGNTQPNGRPTDDDEYLQACLTMQTKRFVKLQKEIIVEQERLQLLIKEISERDHDLYDRRYRVAPDPTNEEVKAIGQEVKQLEQEIGEISNNIDRLDNGQDILPPANPHLNRPHRFIQQRPPVDAMKFDRSKSVPDTRLPQGVSKPQLNRPLSENVSPLRLDLDNNSVQYHLTPSSDASLHDWNLVNQSNPDQNQISDVNNDEGLPWNCSHCTFLNHESLKTCEMCYNDRYP